MNALLGKITKVRKSTPSARKPGTCRMEVWFKPACIMPGRSKVPEWVSDQVLKVTRKVADPREVGSVGDSIVLTPGESANWLFPLVVEPAVVYGKLPARIRLTLRWWKDQKPGEFNVCANGRRRTGKFVKRGGKWTASVVTREFFDSTPSPPIEFAVSFDKLEVGCVVLPADSCCHQKLRTIFGTHHRIESEWYALDICSARAGGGISAMREKARGVNHFRTDDDMIHDVFEHGGYVEQVRMGWSQRMQEAEMTSAIARRQGQTTRLCLEGVLDKDKNVRTGVVYTVFDHLPLVSIQRDVLFHRPDKKDDKKDRKEPAEPIDEMVRVSVSFRAAYPLETNGPSGSRILSVDDDRFAVVRCVRPHNWFWPYWRLRDGWAIVEHPARKECTMYLFDKPNAPMLGTWLGQRVVTLEPRWLPLPVRPESGTGIAVAISAGEVCGAEVAGAWVALRRRAAGGGVQCALIGRFRDPAADPVARFQVGSQSVEVRTERLLLPGVGEIYVASGHLPKGRMDARFNASAGGIGGRSTT